MKKPQIPMSPRSLPQQRVVGIPGAVERPDPFESVIGMDEKPTGAGYPEGPNNPEYLGQVEWASTLVRVVAFYLHRARRHWVLWEYWYDDNWERWEWTSVGYVLREQASMRQAAVHLMVDYWRAERSNRSLEHYGWINQTGYLSTGEWRMIGLSVWPEVAVPLRVEGES